MNTNLSNCVFKGSLSAIAICVLFACGGGGGGDSGSDVSSNAGSSGEIGESISAIEMDNDVYSKSATWSENTVLGFDDSEYDYASVHKYENLTINEGVVASSFGVSNVIIKVKDTLTLKKGAVIQVRNGFYPESPSIPINSLTEDTVSSYGVAANYVMYFPELYGKGGDGGNGSSGSPGRTERIFLGYGQYTWATGIDGYGGGGGGGGYGGGVAGKGASPSGKDGENNGGRGGYGGANTRVLDGGGATGIGETWNVAGTTAGPGGGGNGGSGAPGGRMSGGYAHLNGTSGGGGGGGGYGGGVLTIIAPNIVIEDSDIPPFIVTGQRGGFGRSSAGNGEDGEGGMLVIISDKYTADPKHWTVDAEQNMTHLMEDGHGIPAGSPQLVFVNGEDVTSMGLE